MGAHDAAAPRTCGPSDRHSEGNGWPPPCVVVARLDGRNRPNVKKPAEAGPLARMAYQTVLNVSSYSRPSQPVTPSAGAVFYFLRADVPRFAGVDAASSIGSNAEM